MSTIELSDAATCLTELVARVQNGETIELTEGTAQVALLVPPQKVKPRPVFGSLKGPYWMSDDFDDSLEDEFDCLK